MIKHLNNKYIYQLFGIFVFVFIWYLFGVWATYTGDMIFESFAIVPTVDAFIRIASNGILFDSVSASLSRVIWGMFYAILIGVPFGILLGLNNTLQQMFSVPIQFLRMTSPLSLMPIVVMVIPTWNSGIIFLLAFAGVWAIILASSTAVKRIDKGWLKVAENYQITFLQKIRIVIIPAIIPDLFTGIRLSLGVCWVVLVPAEFLGVTSGLGYAINDARDTLDYSVMMALVLVIGAIGYAIDTLLRTIVGFYEWQR